MAEFIAGYISGVVGILLGSPLDILKVRLQATPTPTSTSTATATPIFPTPLSLVRGVAAPILSHGALNALVFGAYNRFLALFPHAGLAGVWVAGAASGLAAFAVNTPTELLKCRVQVLAGSTSWGVARSVYAQGGVRALYRGGGVTAVRDAVGFGWYFWAYEGSKSALEAVGVGEEAWILAAGGVAGCVSWASVYPLDVVKTRMQTVDLGEREPLIGNRDRMGAWECAKHAYATEGISVFWRGMGVCMLRAFLVNAVQFAVYEYVMQRLTVGKRHAILETAVYLDH